MYSHLKALLNLIGVEKQVHIRIELMTSFRVFFTAYQHHTLARRKANSVSSE